MAAPAQEGSSWFSSFTDKLTGIFSDSPEKIQKEYDECNAKCSDKKKTREDKLNGTGKPFYQFWGGKRRKSRRMQKGGDFRPTSAGSSLKYGAVGGKKRGTKRRTQKGGSNAQPPQPNISEFTSSATEIAASAKQTGGKRRKSSKKGRK